MEYEVNEADWVTQNQGGSNEAANENLFYDRGNSLRDQRAKPCSMVKSQNNMAFNCKAVDEFTTD